MKVAQPVQNKTEAASASVIRVRPREELEWVGLNTGDWPESSQSKQAEGSCPGWCLEFTLLMLLSKVWEKPVIPVSYPPTEPRQDRMAGKKS